MLTPLIKIRLSFLGIIINGYQITIISWQKLNLNLTFPKKYVLYVIALLLGEKNGQTVGMKSNIVPKDVGDVSQKLTNKPTHNSLISSS